MQTGEQAERRDRKKDREEGRGRQSHEMERWRSPWGRRQETGKAEVRRRALETTLDNFLRLWAPASTLTYVPNL